MVRPNGYRIESEYIINKEEVYPAQSQATFHITMADLLPKGADPDKATDSGDPIVIALATFRAGAVRACNRASQKAQSAVEPKSSPYSSDQEGVSTPSDSSSPEPVSEAEEPDDPKDSDYVTDSSDSEDPHWSKDEGDVWDT